MARGYLSTSLGWAQADRHTRATGSLTAETLKLQRFPLKWPLLGRTQHGNLISSHFFWPHTTLRACFQVTSGAEAWSHINIRGVSEQRDTQYLAAEEQNRTKAMDVPRLFLLLLCALHLTCKYCLLYSILSTAATISRLTDQLMERKLISNRAVIFQASAGCSFICVRFSLSFMIQKEKSLGFGLLVGQRELSEDVPLGSGKVWWAFFQFLTFYRQSINSLWKHSVQVVALWWV